MVFSNTSAISWRPVLVVEEAGVPVENHRPWTSNWCILFCNLQSHAVLVIGLFYGLLGNLTTYLIEPPGPPGNYGAFLSSEYTFSKFTNIKPGVSYGSWEGPLQYFFFLICNNNKLLIYYNIVRIHQHRVILLKNHIGKWIKVFLSEITE